MRILFLSSWYPYPTNNGSKIRIFNLLRGLAQQHDISLISFSDDAHSLPPAPLVEVCQHIHVLKAPIYHPARAKAMLGFFSSQPRYLADMYSAEMDALIRAEVKRGCDLVIASQWGMAAYHAAFQHCPAIFEEAELGSFESKRAGATTRMARLRHTLPLLKLRSYSQHVLQYFRACTVVSSIEAERVRSMAPRFEAIQTIPNGVDLESYTAVAERASAAPRETNTLIFTGSFRYDANHDAMQWFVGEVMPRAMKPDRWS